MDAPDYHSACVGEWSERAAKDLTPDLLIEAFDRAFTALWGRAHQTLGNVTLTATTERVLYTATEHFSLLAALRFEEGLRCEELRRNSAVLPRDELAAGLRFILAEFLTILGNLTAEVLTPALHAELARAAPPESHPAAARPTKRFTPKRRIVKLRGTEHHRDEHAFNITSSGVVISSGENHGHIASRDERIAELERSQWRLQRLYQISTLLTPLEDPERSVPKVVAVVAETVPLRSAILIWKARGEARVVTWQAAGEAPERLGIARQRAQIAYGYLVRARIDLADAGGDLLELPRLAAGPAQAAAEADRTFVALPCVVDHDAIFGVLQIEGARAIEEPDLVFINAVLNQLAIALDRQSADRTVHASEERLAGIVATAADAIISIDETHGIVMYNEGAETTFGWSREEVLGKPLDILLPERFRNAHRRHVSSFAAEPEAARRIDARGPAEIFGLRKSGEEFPAEAAISKLTAHGKRLYTVMLRDITEQKRIEHEKQLLADVGEILAGTLDSAETLSSIARVTLRELADFCVIELIDDHDALQRLDVSTSDPSKASTAAALRDFALDRSRPHLTAAILQSNRPQLMADVSEDALRALAQSEEHLRLLQTMAPRSIMGVPLIARGRLLGALVVGACAPRRRYREADLHLLDEIGRRAALALENARLYGAARRAIRMRDEVLGVVAHDLRNPLQIIRMETALLRCAKAGQDGASASGEAIERATDRMDSLIEDLLDVARMEAGALSIEREEMDTAQFLRDLVAAQRARSSAASVELGLDFAAELRQIRADRDRLLQVFQNLLDNAMTHSARGGRITIGARDCEEQVLFSVADTGSGIAADELPHVFDRFWQGQRQRRGAGLGLAIVKGIVEAHGGSIWVESSVNRGSTFYFTVPVAPPAPRG